MEVQALHIDRRQHLEQAWRRQEVSSFSFVPGHDTSPTLRWVALHCTAELIIQAVQAEQAAMDLEGSSCCGVDCVTELKNLTHLDRIVESSSSSVVAIAFYSRVRSIILWP